MLNSRGRTISGLSFQAGSRLREGNRMETASLMTKLDLKITIVGGTNYVFRKQKYLISCRSCKENIFISLTVEEDF